MKKIQRICLYLFFFSMNFEMWDPLETGGFFSISRAVGILYFLVSIPGIMNFKTRQEYKPILKMILIFFSYLLFINAVNASSTDDTIIDFTILQNIILFWILINHEQSDHMVLEKGMLSFAFGSATLALLYHLGIGIELSEGRVSLFGDNQNAIGQRMSFSIIIVGMIVFQNRQKLSGARFFLLLLTPLLLSLLVATGSRLAMLSFAVAFIAVLVLIKTRDLHFKVIVFVSGLIAFFFIWHLTMQNELLKTRLLMSLQEGHLSERDVIWKNILPLIESNPIFGVGQSGYTAYCEANFTRYISPHSVIMELLCFTGTVGLVIYLFFLYKIFRMGYLTYKRDGFLLPLLFIINVVGLMLVSHILELKIGWAILAYITTSSVISEGVQIVQNIGSESLYPGELNKWIKLEQN